MEKSFDDLKNTLDMSRMHVQTEQTVDGKLFCSFIALIVQSYMRKHLSSYLSEHNLTFEKVLLELKKSKQIVSPKYPSGIRSIDPHSKFFRDIFNLCNINFVC